MKQNLKFNMNGAVVNVDCMEVFAIQSKNGIKDESRCKCKELDDWYSRRDYYMWNPSTCDCECNRACKLYACYY